MEYFSEFLPTATILIEKSKEKSRTPLAQKKVARAVIAAMKRKCPVMANLIPVCAEILGNSVPQYIFYVR